MPPVARSGPGSRVPDPTPVRAWSGCLAGATLMRSCVAAGSGTTEVRRWPLPCLRRRFCPESGLRRRVPIMLNPHLPLSVVMACALIGAGSSVAVAAEVTVVSAARIHTVDPSQPQAQAMAYDEAGRILALGHTDALLARYPDAARIDAGAATIIPGLIDAHGH